MQPCPVPRVIGRRRQSGALLEEPHAAERLKVVGARYDLDDGAIHFFEGA